MLWMLLACGGGVDTEKCNEADAYLNRPNDEGDTQAQLDIHDAGGADCDDYVTDGASEDGAPSACRDYLNAVDDLAECDDECTHANDDECIDTCLEMPSGGSAERAAQDRCRFDCGEWTCE
jgi:hypothetical protein